MKIYKKVFIAIGTVIAVYMLFLMVEYIRFYNKGYGVKPIFVLSESHEDAENGYGGTDKYVGLGYTVTYEHSYEEIYEDGELKGYRDKGYDADIRLFGIGITIGSWYYPLVENIIFN